MTLDRALISLGISVLICACFTSTQGLTCYINRDVSSDEGLLHVGICNQDLQGTRSEGLLGRACVRLGSALLLVH